MVQTAVVQSVLSNTPSSKVKLSVVHLERASSLLNPVDKMLFLFVLQLSNLAIQIACPLSVILNDSLTIVNRHRQSKASPPERY